VKCIIGLGNPGLRYSYTRHNVGFRIIKALAKRHNVRLKRKAFHSLTGEGLINDDRVFLALPLEFMNLSGLAVNSIIKGGPDVAIEDILIVCDDVNLNAGTIRMRPSGSAGGHKGLNSIIQKTGTQDFARLRVGVGAGNLRGDISDFVLGGFSKTEKLTIKDSIDRAVDACECWLATDIEACMSRFNQKNQ